MEPQQSTPALSCGMIGNLSAKLLEGTGFLTSSHSYPCWFEPGKLTDLTLRASPRTSRRRRYVVHLAIPVNLLTSCDVLHFACRAALH